MLADRLESALGSGAPGKVVSLSEMLPGDWTRLVVFPAYTSNLVARETLGFDFDIEATPSQSQDGVEVVVLATNTAVNAWCVLDSARVNFGVESQPQVFDRAAAVFRVGTDSFGDPALVPASPSLEP